MKNKKTIRLLAATWLIAPSVLSTNTVFAVDNQTADQTVTTDTTTSSSATSETTDSFTEDPTGTTNSTTGSTEPTEIDPADPSENEKPAETYSLTIAPSLIGKIQLTASTADSPEQQPLDITESGTVEGLLAETKVTYTITPAEGEQIASVAVNGAKEVNYDAKTFTVGTNNLSITAEFEPVPDTSTEKPTDPSEEVPSTPDPETPNKPDVGNNNNNNGSNNSNNNNNNSNSGNSSNQTNPSGSNNNGNTQREPNHPNNGSSNGGTNNASSRPNTANQSGIENPSSASSDFVVKSPIDAVLPTNTTNVQQAIVREAFKHLGKPYVWGAKGPNTFDCSGLTYYVYMKATGHYIGGWTGEQQYAGTQIPVSQAQPGDLVFWGPSSGVTHHVGIYIGNGQFIHAPQPGDKVRVTSISDFTPDFAVRVNLAGLPAASVSLTGGSSILDGLDGSFHFSQNQTTDQFLKKIADDAQEIGQKEGIYASVMMAQAILESGSGNSLLSSEPNHNLFGIKGSYKGSSVTFNTLEQDSSGQSYQIRAQFRKYPSYKESLEDYADLIKNGLTGNPDFYKPTWKSETKDYKEATKYLEGRYATDRQYSQKLNAIIEAYDLTKYDEPKKEAATTEEANAEILNMSKRFDVPIKWTTDGVPITGLEFSTIKRVNNASSIFRVASIWDLWNNFTARQIPETTTRTVKAATVPVLTLLSLDKSFWLDLPLKK
ncbi:TPA: C40 family peptidase [Enterococcus faecium]|jgi:cell wall-associated NlpC family hydrolase|uniref:glucosaminidase domain-containing protein n=1 Tax=Enterococcus faecium TaxID=1352 RepID=UPI00028264D0|nr:glucosaminidase domain-containing protein [Enterococcus faecium]EGP5556488.1 N-acetylmuramoyl-L-alanine amidase [Enterococcus faecium]EJX48656.1 NlpC/P60 family protein [Enterococcus faecium R499]EKZ0102453.1 C40 family peptidase [Enterococcus faecium]EOG11845.1 N-acetylmuramoyl-L-alanine amidase [Enterococcus faecium EnGen0176]EOM43074.1 N-acetylmuramoyl-L-alanine amidase [Enterococcus faecium EnGen0173]